jgi:DNA-binding NarL/FixJ family response regulator
MKDHDGQYFAGDASGRRFIGGNRIPLGKGGGLAWELHILFPIHGAVVCHREKEASCSASSFLVVKSRRLVAAFFLRCVSAGRGIYLCLRFYLDSIPAESGDTSASPTNHATLRELQSGESAASQVLSGMRRRIGGNNNEHVIKSDLTAAAFSRIFIVIAPMISKNENLAPSKNDKGRARIFIVDDHPLLRQGIQGIVNQTKDLEVCGNADSAQEALAGIESTRPNLAIVDLSLKGSNGLNLIKDLQIRHPSIIVLVLSMHNESFYVERALRAGAKGYITKEEATQKLVEGIRRVLAGEIYLSDTMASKLIGKIVGGSSQGPLEETLSDRELEVFELIGAGHGTRQIADHLHVSIKTVESHREHIKQKLKLTSALELVKHAVDWVNSHQGG